MHYKQLKSLRPLVTKSKLGASPLQQEVMPELDGDAPTGRSGSRVGGPGFGVEAALEYDVDRPSASVSALSTPLSSATPVTGTLTPALGTPKGLLVVPDPGGGGGGGGPALAGAGASARERSSSLYPVVVGGEDGVGVGFGGPSHLVASASVPQPLPPVSLPLPPLLPGSNRAHSGVMDGDGAWELATMGDRASRQSDCGPDEVSPSPAAPSPGVVDLMGSPSLRSVLSAGGAGGGGGGGGAGGGGAVGALLWSVPRATDGLDRPMGQRPSDANAGPASGTILMELDSALAVMNSAAALDRRFSRDRTDSAGEIVRKTAALVAGAVRAPQPWPAPHPHPHLPQRLPSPRSRETLPHLNHCTRRLKRVRQRQRGQLQEQRVQEVVLGGQFVAGRHYAAGARAGVY
jgi:hypothetical protein